MAVHDHLNSGKNAAGLAGSKASGAGQTSSCESGIGNSAMGSAQTPVRTIGRAMLQGGAGNRGFNRLVQGSGASSRPARGEADEIKAISEQKAVHSEDPESSKGDVPAEKDADSGGEQNPSKDKAAASEEAGGQGASGAASGPAATGSGSSGASKTAAKTGLAKITHSTVLKAKGASNNRTTVGVGERVRFTSKETGTWTATDAKAGTAKTGSGKTFLWQATSKAATVSISFKAAGAPQKTNMKVIPPQSIKMKKTSAPAFPGQAKGISGAMMISDVYFLPFSVSFGNAMWLEVPGPASGMQGYFAGKTPPYHHPNPSYLQISARNGGLNDTAGFWGFAKPWAIGSFEWAIPNKYRVTGESTGYEFTTTHQVCSLTANGTVRVTKAGAVVRRSP